LCLLWHAEVPGELRRREQALGCLLALARLLAGQGEVSQGHHLGERVLYRVADRYRLLVASNGVRGLPWPRKCSSGAVRIRC
jgi:hypothetical protein